jgi:hypothetical protein
MRTTKDGGACQQPLLRRGSTMKDAKDRTVTVLGIERDGVRVQIEGVRDRPLVAFADIEAAIGGGL